MTQARFELVFLEGKRAGESVPLEGVEVTIGRSRSNTLLLEDPLVSRHHVKLSLTGNAVMLHDLESSHGTFLNNKRVRGSVSLNPGDVLQVGDTKLRFSAPENTDAEKTAFVDVDASDASKSSATHFADGTAAGGQSETGFMPVEEPPPEDPGERTVVFAEGETRLIDDAEMKGLRAAAAAPVPRKKKMIVAAALVMLALFAAVAVLTRPQGGGPAASSGATYTDREYGFSIENPAGWKRSAGTGGALIHFARGNASLAVYADKSIAYGSTGLLVGFDNYADTLAARHEGMNLDGSKVMRVNNATVVFYSYTSPGDRGKGIFLLSGDRRICVECSAPGQEYEALAQDFSALLKRFKLTDEQDFIDFPAPDQSLKRVALANPAQVEAAARREFEIGEELLKNRTVKTENSYLAVQTLKRSLTTASALSTRPEFYARAAGTLAEAQRSLAKAIRDQKLQIVLAERRNDREAAYWEAVKLMQVIPDKNNENYQYAARCMKTYATKVKE